MSAHNTISWFLKRNLASKKGLVRSIQSHESQGPTSKITLFHKAIIYNGRADKVFPRQGKVKGIHHHQALIIWNVKGIYLRKRRRSKIQTIKWQKTHNCQQPNLKKQKQKQKWTKQTTRTGRDSQKQRSHGGLSAWRRRGEWEKMYRE